MTADMHERTLIALGKLVDVLDCEELSLICWHCGVQPNDLMASMPTNYGYIRIHKETQRERTA